MAGFQGAYHSANNVVAARKGVSITPNDSTNYVTTRAVYVGTSGNLTVDMVEDYGGTFQVTFTNVAAGIFPIQVTRVYATGTTASNIVLLY